MSIEEIKLPDVGGEEVEVIEVCVKSGDSIEEEEAIIVVETEKASMDIPANFGGTIESISVKAGDKLSEGDLVCTMKKEDSTQDEQPKEDTKEEPKEEVKQEETQKEEEPKEEKQEESQSVETSSVVEDIVVPDLGEDGEVDVIEISVSAGDEVEEEDGLITLETEKATMDVPSPAKGKIVELTVKAGDKVSTGTVIGKIEKQLKKQLLQNLLLKKRQKSLQQK